MPDKLTDKEIVKGLELEVNKKSCIHEEYEEACGMWCKHYHKWCEDMSGKNEKDNCSAFKPTAPTKRAKATLDLINRLQAENERLENFKAYFDFYYGCDVEILGIDENGDTTSFDEFYNCAIANAESIEHHIAHIIKTAKAEAYKEFAERLKGTFPKDDFLRSTKRISEDIDNLLKELVGDK